MSLPQNGVASIVPNPTSHCFHAKWKSPRWHATCESAYTSARAIFGAQERFLNIQARASSHSIYKFSPKHIRFFGLFEEHAFECLPSWPWTIGAVFAFGFGFLKLFELYAEELLVLQFVETLFK